jgi:uncharacterized protein YkwD
MNLHTLCQVALSAIIITSGTMVDYVSNATSANTPQIQQNLPNEVIKVAQATTPNLGVIEQAIFNQINQYRASKGLPAFARSSKIDNQAKVHSQNMASAKVPFGHQNFSDRVKSTGISYKAAAENVAYNKGYADPATQAVQGWLKSPGHKTNIEGKFNQTGIGVAVNSKGEVYFTQIFITSR